MSRLIPALALVAILISRPALAVGPTVAFTLPAENSTPAVFGSLPFPDDLYFDQGRPGDGDGTLLNTGALIGLGVDVARANSASFEDAIDLLDGFGTTTAIYFFLSGPVDVGSLPASPVVSPALTQSVFCADTATLTPVPIAIKANVDSRIPNVLAVLPLAGRPLKAKTSYTCVVRTGVTGGGDPVEPSADWVSVRDGTSTNGDADAIYDPVVTALGTAGVPASAIAGMTVFTTQATTDALIAIRDVVLPGLAVPTANFTSRPELVFDTPAELVGLVGANPHDHIAKVATGFYESARFQTHDPNGDGFLGDLPNTPGFVTCAVPCETTDERFTHDGGGLPVVIDQPEIPFTVVIPSGTPPPDGWPVIIQQHGLGGQRDTVLGFGELDAAKGFASIGIDAAAHGYRYFDCGPGAPCAQDVKNFVGGTTVPDGFIDGDFSVAGLSASFLSVNLGFFQAFHNFLGIRDNFRQTYADLLSLVRLLHGHSIDGALGTTLDDTHIFYMGHSLGGLMGSGFVPIEADLSASLLNATGGGLTSQLFLNSSIGAGAQSLVQGILGLDPANVQDQFALQPNITQMIIDPADGLNSASLLLAPVDGAPRNVIQVEDFGDQVVPNPANEALAVAAGLPLFDPFVQNLHQNAFTLPIVPTQATVSGNVAGATAALIQNGPATHAASLSSGPGTLTFVPDFALVDEFPLTGQAFPNLSRSIRIKNAGIFDSIAAWFRDVADNGPPGTFSFGGQPNFNPIENAEAPVGGSTLTYFARTVSAGGSASFSEPTPDVVLTLAGNTVETRVTAARTILGTDAIAIERDVPPGEVGGVGTPGVLPFFVSLQRALPGTVSGSLEIAYTATELAVAGIPAGSADESALKVGLFASGNCNSGGASCQRNSDCTGVGNFCVGAGYTFLPTTIDTGTHTATATGLTALGTFALLHPDAVAGGYVPPLVPGGASPRRDCRAEFQVMNPTNTPFLDSRGRVNSSQTCTDGDPACDADRVADGTCTFRLAVCLNRVDPSLPSCPVDTTASFTLRRPLPLASDLTDAANAQALLGRLVALGGTQGGARQNVVTFSPEVSGSTCTALANFRVPAAGNGTKVFRGRSRSGSGLGAADRLRFHCVP